MSTCGALVRSLLTLRKERRSGVLTVTPEGAAKTFIYLDEGTPVFAEEGTHGETLGRLLLKQKKLTQEQYVEVIAKMTDALFINEQLRFGELAVELGFLTEEQVAKALADQVRWKIVRVLQRPDATWEFEESVSRLEDVGRFPMSIEALVLHAMRWVDDEDRLELGLGAALDKRMKVEPMIVPLVVGSFELNEDDEKFVASLDGSRPLRELLATSEADAVDAQAIATALLLTRALQPAGTAPLPTPDRPFVPVKLQASRVTVRTADPSPPPPSVEAPPPTRPAAAAPPPAAPPKKVVRPQVTRAAQILQALEAQRVKTEPSRTPTSEHEAKLLGERLFQRGLDQLRSGRYAQAAPTFEQAAKLLPQSDEYRLYAKWCAIRARSEPAHVLERQELKRLAGAAVKTDPNFGFGHAVLGELAMDEGDVNQAHRFLVRAVKLEPALLEAQRNLRIVERRIDPKKKSIRRDEG